MENEQVKELKEFILNEMGYRSKFQKLRNELMELVEPISKHNREFYAWWLNNIHDDVKDIIVIMDNETTLKIHRPEKEECCVNTYLPYSVDFESVKLIHIEGDKKQ